MNNEELKQMCLSLLQVDTEEQVIKILKDKGFWDSPESWRYYGDREDNYSAIGNQQSRPEAALVEKVVNSVDAVLMNKCWLSGTSPEDANAPKSIHEAVALYFAGDAKKFETQGHIAYWSPQKRTEVSRLITLAATGATAGSKDSTNPCFIISDCGEGQTPNSMPSTLLSLDKKNKFKIQFVQGKFNMGGTGVLQFCGHHKLQFIVSHRNPQIVNSATSDDSAGMWGFTVIRREDPAPGGKSSIYTYLAPLGANQKPRNGEILRFNSNSLPILPSGKNAYGREAEWGTAIKLYEYTSTGFRTMMFRDGLLSRLDIMLPEIALPMRLHECRDYKGHAGSWETTLSGLSVRLDDDKAGNIEENFPTTSLLGVAGEQMTAKIYAFMKGKAENYRKNEGIIFTVNGQTHAYIPRTFFSRKNVGMGRLDGSILVIIDCSKLTGRAREDLFMNSRDRLRNGDLRDAIEHQLELMIRDHQGLKELREKRKHEEVASKTADSKPLEEALKSILKSSPSLASIFLTGTKLSNPFKTKEVSSDDTPYKGKLHPSYFKFQKLQYKEKLERAAAINMKCRITFVTDVVNDYFARLENKGIFSLCILNVAETKKVDSYSLNLQNGKASLNLKLPGNCSVGDVIAYQAEVTDDTLPEPFVNVFVLTVGPPQQVTAGGGKKGKTPTDKDGNEQEAAVGIAMPEINDVYEKDWEKRKHKFNQFSALEIIQEEAAEVEGNGSPAVYSFWINMDNIYLKTEMKSSKIAPELLKARFKFAMALIGMALIRGDAMSDKLKTDDESGGQNANDGTLNLDERVFQISAAVAPIILPMIESLGALNEEQFTVGSQVGDDE